MKALIQGLYNLFMTVNTFRTAIGGRMFFGEAPSNTAYPFAVLHLITDTPERLLDDQLEDVLLQINIYSNKPESAQEVVEIYQKAIALFDDATVTVAGYFCYYLHRGLSHLLRDPNTGDDERGAWQYSIEYEALIRVQPGD